MSNDHFILGDANGLCMSMTSAALDSVYALLRNAIRTANGGAGLFIAKADANFCNIRRGKPARAMPNRHIPAVFNLRSFEKVAWIYASRIVASMKSAFIFLEDFMVEFVRKAMRSKKISAIPKLSIAKFMCAAHPNPARISFANLAPKLAYGTAICITLHFWLKFCSTAPANKKFHLFCHKNSAGK